MLVGTAFDDLFEAALPHLRRSVVYIARDGWEADDVVQELYLRLCTKARPQIVLAHPNPRGYLHRSALNLLYDRWRHEERYRRLPVELSFHADSTWDGGIEVAEVRQVMTQAMRALSRAEAIAIVLVDLQGFTIADAAHQLGVHAGTVKRNRRRGLERLRSTLSAVPTDSNERMNTLSRKHIVTADGRSLLIEDVDADYTHRAARRFFESIGGADFFHKFALAFYRLVKVDPVIGPMFRASPEHHAERLADHYIRMYGTPDLSEGWNPDFLRSHLGVVIGNRHRERWLELMRRAGEEVGAKEPWFSDFLATMITVSGAVSAASRGAALARGFELDRQGVVVTESSKGALAG